MDKSGRLQNNRKFRIIFWVIVMVFLTGCSGKEKNPEIEWKPEHPLAETAYLRISLPEDRESVADMSYCQGTVYYFHTSPLNMRLNPEFFSVKKFEIASESAETLYEASAGTVLQDLVAAQEELFWVEIIPENDNFYWKLVRYGINDKEIEILREGKLGEDTVAEPVLTLSGGYLLWTETDTAMTEHHYSYRFSSKTVKEEKAVLSGINPYIGDRMLEDSLFYLAAENGMSGLWENDRRLYSSQEEVMGFSVTDTALLWVYKQRNSGYGNARYVPWTQDRVPGSGTELPYEDLFTAHMFDGMIVCIIPDKGEYYYAFLDAEMGERYTLYPKPEWDNTFYYPWYSADKTVYLKGSGDCLILKK